MEKLWLLIQSKPREENRALINLCRQGFECRLFQIEKVKRRNGFKLARLEPLFPRYIFVYWPSVGVPRWRQLNYTYGVSHIVRFGHQWAWVDNELILSLEQQLNYLRTHRIQAFQPGAKVRIVDGPLKGLEAIFEMPRGEDRAIILLDFLNRSVRSEIDLQSLELIPQSL